MTDNKKTGLVNREDLEYDKALKEFALNVPCNLERSDEESFSLLLKVADLVEDKLALYDLLADESEGGNTLALDVMNEIWPPENIIEED